jgi:NAD+ kinase
MNSATVFKRVALIGRQRGETITETLLALKSHLQSHKVEVVFDKETAAMMLSQGKPAVPGDQLSQYCDLMIAVGGDGSYLKAAQIAVNQHLPVLGINRGRLGFLTDIRPEEFSKVSQVLNGEYIEEHRFLLTAELQHHDKVITKQDALNDVVLLPGAAAHMIEFAIYINHKLVNSQRADGLIVATPTGSTAYSLSGGGPILHPSLNAIVLVPMFPHTLSSRPIVISGDSSVDIVINEENKVSPFVSCDGQRSVAIDPGGKIKIEKKAEQLRLIHPKDYNYFETLRVKLGWGNMLSA